MNELDRVFAAAGAVCKEATRRSFGDPPDARFDVPVAMLLDLYDDLEAADDPAASDPSSRSDGRTRSETAAGQAS